MCFREVVTSVEFSPDGLSGARVLLVHRWPRGVYVDPFQVAALSGHNDWQVWLTLKMFVYRSICVHNTCINYCIFVFTYKILLDSAIDLEMPAHKTSGFVTYVFPSPDELNPKQLKVTIPIHGRYHEPSFNGETVISVDIEPPELLFQTEKCKWKI